MYNNRLKKNSKEQKDLWICEEARINPQEMFFSKKPANKLWTLCAIFYWCETDMRKVNSFQSLKVYLTAVAFLFMKLNYHSRPLSELLVVTSVRNIDRESYKEIP